MAAGSFLSIRSLIRGLLVLRSVSDYFFFFYGNTDLPFAHIFIVAIQSWTKDMRAIVTADEEQIIGGVWPKGCNDGGFAWRSDGAGRQAFDAVRVYG